MNAAGALPCACRRCFADTPQFAVRQRSVAAFPVPIAGAGLI